MKHRLPAVLRHAIIVAPLALGAFEITTVAQDRLKTMPGYQQYLKASAGDSRRDQARCLGRDLERGRHGRSTTPPRAGVIGSTSRRSARARLAIAEAPAGGRGQRVVGGRGTVAGAPERGRQFDAADSPDGKLKAFYRDRNL